MAVLDHVLIAIDGTDSSSWRNAMGTNSHIYQFHKRFNAHVSQKFYFDGPNALGTDTETIARHAMAELLHVLHTKAKMPGGPKIHSQKGGYASLPLEASGNVRVSLVGHSRGGLITIWMANELSRHGIPVYFMGLYDTVDRAMGLDPFDPPEGSKWRLGIDSDSLSNVFNTYHALRDPALRSRTSFGNAGRNPLDASQKYEEMIFHTSHGGIGGDPAPEGKVVHSKRAGITYKQYGVTSDLTCVDERGEERVALCNNQSAAAGKWIVDQARSLSIPIQ